MNAISIIIDDIGHVVEGISTAVSGNLQRLADDLKTKRAGFEN